MAAGIVCFPALAYLILGYGKHIYKKQQNGGTGKMKNEAKENTQKKENIEYKECILISKYTMLQIKTKIWNIQGVNLHMF